MVDEFDREGNFVAVADSEADAVFEVDAHLSFAGMGDGDFDKGNVRDGPGLG